MKVCRRVLLVFAAVAACWWEPAAAQSLNSEIERLLANNCEGLAPIGRTQRPLDPNDFGPNLIVICPDFPETVSPSSSGGGATSVAASTTSIHNGAVRRRLEKAREELEEDEEDDDNGALLWRPYAERETALLFFDSRSAEEPEAGAATPGLKSRRLGIFGSAGAEALDRDVTPFEDGYDSSVFGITAGVDYRFTDRIVAGFVATASQQSGDFEGGGDFEITSLIPSAYLSVLPSDRTFLQVVAGINFQEYDVDRAAEFTTIHDPFGTPVLLRIGGVASSETDGTVVSASAQFGYDHPIGSLTIGPRVGLNYGETTVDAFEEEGNSGLEMRVEEFSVKSVQGVLGFFGSAAISGQSGVFVPQLTVEYVHEFEDEASLLTAQFVEDLRGPGAATLRYQTNDPDSDFFHVEVGASAVFANGIQPYGSIRMLLGNDNFDSLAALFGVRFEL